MKTFFLITLFAATVFSLSAQHSLQSELNLPRAGDELVKEQVVFLESGESGENQIWDFSTLKLIDDACIVSYFLTLTVAPLVFRILLITNIL